MQRGIQRPIVNQKVNRKEPSDSKARFEAEGGNRQNTMDIPDLEIVGLASSTNGRSCTLHTCCGEHVEHGDVLCLVKTVVSVNKELEEAVACVKVVDGVDSCTVGFVPRVFAGTDRVKDHINKFVMVKELYEDSLNS